MPFRSFELNDALLRGIRALGFERPTTIQQEALPPALSGRDLLACATTGSGKTAAFALPILQRLAGRPPGGTRALVLTPTRELAAQNEEHLRGLGRFTRITSTAVFGGAGMAGQQRALQRGVDVVVATPGRLLDHLRMPYARFNQLEILVLDEADRMLDMGFLRDVERILQRLPTRRQTLFFSATLPPAIVALSRRMLSNPVTIAVDRKQSPAPGVRQVVYAVPPGLKAALLAELVKRGEIRSVIAFTRTKHRANRLADFLAKNGVSAERIHGNRSQAQRTQALSAFKARRVPVLVATDVAARGIDVAALSHVVNFDVPTSPADYVHRVGRTARAAATGDALSFVSAEEEPDLRNIERAIGQRIPRQVLEGFDYGRSFTDRLDDRAPRPQRRPLASHPGRAVIPFRAARPKRHLDTSLRGRSARPGQASRRRRAGAPGRP